MVQNTFELADLLELMQRLRDPVSGCPWDIKQDYRSITPSTIEEAYEVVDAIEHDDFQHLREELGDLLFQVIFYSQLAKEDGHFDFAAVVDNLTAKLIRRHPHVFPDGTLAESASTANVRLDDGEVKAQWEAIKAQERGRKGNFGVLADVPLALPALSRAAKLQKRASKVGFDWRTAAPVLEKVREELVELEQAMSSSDEASVTEELGDVLFSVVNLTRHLKRDPEQVLRGANSKFVQRFEYIERSLLRQGVAVDQVDEQLLDRLWHEAKNQPAPDA